jgi:hypothetical protein
VRFPQGSPTTPYASLREELHGLVQQFRRLLQLFSRICQSLAWISERVFAAHPMNGDGHLLVGGHEPAGVLGGEQHRMAA